MTAKFKAYSAFMTDKYKIITNCLIPIISVFICIIGRKMAWVSGACLFIFLYVEGYQDYWGLNGITKKGFTGLEYVKTAPNGMKHTMNAFYGDMIVRAIRCLVEVLVSFLLSIIRGEHIAEAIFVYLILFSLATLGLNISRSFNTIFAQSLCASVVVGFGMAFYAGLTVAMSVIDKNKLDSAWVKLDLGAALLAAVIIVFSINYTRKRLSILFEENSKKEA